MWCSDSRGGWRISSAGWVTPVEMTSEWFAQLVEVICFANYGWHDGKYLNLNEIIHVKGFVKIWSY